MATLVWDNVGERIFQAGVDRGVLYLPDNSGVVWNGLTSVTENFDREVKSYYIDGVKYLETHILGDFSGDLRAFTYPDEFDSLCGITVDEDTGILFHDQNPQSFGLSYRTMIGDDVSDLDRGYIIHIMYNLMANPHNVEYTSLSDQITPIEFGWSLSGTPVIVAGHRPTGHISINSTKIDSGVLSIIETMLYGSSESSPRLLSLSDLIVLISPEFRITIIDNGDGTWTAIGSDTYIGMLDDATFQITEANANYLDVDRYDISTTED